jgi:hypothetical protein
MRVGGLRAGQTFPKKGNATLGAKRGVSENLRRHNERAIRLDEVAVATRFS